MLSYIQHYPLAVQQQVQQMIEQDRLHSYLTNKYPDNHQIGSDKALRDYVNQFKNRYLKKAEPLSKVVFDGKIHVVNQALGLHSYTQRIQGGKIKSKHEIRIGALFKHAPAAFLDMIIVHELAHLKEKDHNKAFYQLCQHMLPDYFQLEFDLRLYLIHQTIQSTTTNPA